MTEQATHRTIEINESVLGKNQALADSLRAQFLDQNTVVINIMSSPGSGKTALLEATLTHLAHKIKCAVIVGDCATDNDARRLSGHGADVVQITTGGYCHLDASMVASALESIDTSGLQLLFIENVGNLVCPSGFDLGEDKRVVVISVTEGEDKPLKYPAIFSRADLIVVNKIDMAHAAGWDEVAAEEAIIKAAPDTPVLNLSARSGEGLHAWCNWLEELVGCKKAGECHVQRM
jgi:hydrogenase nickel incorporation protein HypB